MTFSNYLRDKQNVLILQLISAIGLAIFLYLIGNEIGVIMIIVLCWITILIIYLAVDYWKRDKYLQQLLSITESLDKKYLTSEISDKPDSIEAQIYFHIMKAAMRSMTEEVSLSQRQNTQYQDFIERWVHEIKVPITATKLICENNKTDNARRVLSQIELIEGDVERVLYFARMGNVEKDYFISEVNIKEIVCNVLARNKQFLIHKNVLINTDNIIAMVYSDGKWIEFIINQIIVNCVKYKSQTSPHIKIYTLEKEQSVKLSITDNGIGIKESEISRIFEKGFTGSNGRAGENATGIGLYICKELCRKLGIAIEAESVFGEYTTIRLLFPKGNYLNN